jgi:hypothetical protein
MDEQEAGSLAGWGDVILTGKEVADQIENVKYQPKSVQKAKQSDGVFSQIKWLGVMRVFAYG